MRAGNEPAGQQDRSAHAERSLTSQASLAYTAEFLRKGRALHDVCRAAYWAGVGRAIYALSERELDALIGRYPENLTMDMPCRTVLAAGKRAVAVTGPLFEDEARAGHVGIWS